MSQFLALTEFISRNAEWYPEKTAIVFKGQKLSWKAFNQRINRIANRLLQSGLAKGDRVAILSRNCLEYPEIMFGALKAGAAIVPMSTMLQKETVQLQLRDSDPEAIFAGFEDLPLLEQNLSTKHRIVLGGQAEDWIPYEEFLRAGPEDEPVISLAEDDLCYIIYSSGTTGTPKGIVHTQSRGRFLSLLPRTGCLHPG